MKDKSSICLIFLLVLIAFLYLAALTGCIIGIFNGVFLWERIFSFIAFAILLGLGCFMAGIFVVMNLED